MTTLTTTTKEESPSLKEDSTFKEALEFVLEREGGYVDNPADHGGATNYGVTQKTYNKYRDFWKLPLNDVKSITLDEVYKVYEDYWNTCESDKLCRTHPRTAIVHFDFALNAGTRQAAKTLQRSIGGLLVDGIIGPKTLAGTLASTDIELAADYLENRKVFYHGLARDDETQRVFLKGWLKRVTLLRKLIDDRPELSIQSDSVSGSTE